MRAALTRVEPGAELENALVHRWDVALVDPHGGGWDAAGVVARIRRQQPDLPLVVLSGEAGELEDAAAQGGPWVSASRHDPGGLAAVVERELVAADARRAGAPADAALELAEGHLEALEASMPDETFAFDAEGRVLRASGGPAGARAGGARARWQEIAAPGLEGCLARALHGTPTSHEWSTGLAGQERWFEARLNPVVLNGYVVGAVAAVRDVSELKTLTARLAMSDRMAAIGSIAAGVAHDLAAPVAAALAALEDATRLVAGRAAALGEDGPAVQRAIADARAAGEQIRAVARDLRTFSRADPPGVMADAADVLESAVRMAAHELRNRAKVVRDYREVPRVAASPSRLGQVLLNLLVNAAHAIRPGAPDRNEVRLRTALATDGRVAIEVEDTGAGMTPEIRRRIFTPFFTTKPDGVGTGLGLSICQRIVEGLGGAIEVRSQPGVGTSFRVLVPSAGDPRAAPASTGPATAADGGDGSHVPDGQEERPRVLVVDDEAAVHRALGRLLGKTCDVACAEAAAALHRLEAGERFDLVLCDVSMAGLSGIELYARVKALDPDQARRVVFLSGGAFGPQAREFFRETAAAVLDKASPPDELRAAVAAHLRALGRVRAARAGV